MLQIIVAALLFWVFLGVAGLIVEWRGEDEKISDIGFVQQMKLLAKAVLLGPFTIGRW